MGRKKTVTVDQRIQILELATRIAVAQSKDVNAAYREMLALVAEDEPGKA